MGSAKFGNSSIASAFYGNTEVLKIYYGPTLIYEKYVAPTTYTLTVKRQQGCSVSPSSAVTVNSGGSQTYAITPTVDSGYACWFDICGTLQGVLNPTYVLNEKVDRSDAQLDFVSSSSYALAYTVSNVTSNKSLGFEFDRTAITTNTFTVTKAASSSRATQSIAFSDISSDLSGLSIQGRYVRVIGTLTFNDSSSAFDEKVLVSTSSTTTTIFQLGDRLVFVSLIANRSGSFALSASGRNTAISGSVEFDSIVFY